MNTVLQDLLQNINNSSMNVDDIKKYIIQEGLNNEQIQIEKSFNEGMKYGSSILPPFDYPSSRYYNIVYKTKK